MSLDVKLKDPTATYDVEDLYSANITHNLIAMADKAGIYNALWHPYKLLESYDAKLQHLGKYANVLARIIIQPLEIGLEKLRYDPDYYRKFNSPNGWGLYDHFVPFVEKYLEACKKYPMAIVEVDV